MVLFFLAAASTTAAAAGPPSATEILRRSEEVRAPAIDYAADFTIEIVDSESHGGTEHSGKSAPARRSDYSMVVRGKDETIAIMRAPEPFFGGTLLIQRGSFWLLLPKAERPFQLSAAQVLHGDVSNGDIARANLLDAYEPRLDGEEALEGAPCWRLELTRTRATASYPRARLWVEKRGYLPRKLESYGMTGELLRTAVYGDFRKGPIGLRPMRIDFQDATGARGRTRMVFSNIQKVDASSVRFGPEGMASFRDAAVATRSGAGADLDLKRALAALRPAKS